MREKLNCILHPQIDGIFSKAAICREESVASPGFPLCRDFTFPALGTFAGSVVHRDSGVSPGDALVLEGILAWRVPSWVWGIWGST